MQIAADQGGREVYRMHFSNWSGGLHLTAMAHTLAGSQKASQSESHVISMEDRLPLFLLVVTVTVSSLPNIPSDLHMHTQKHSDTHMPMQDRTLAQTHTNTHVIAHTYTNINSPTLAPNL